ncbi:ribosome-binding factor A [Synergistales bacterium]|nr:ribosome-binding factor A [Synergistales bacterium]
MDGRTLHRPRKARASFRMERINKQLQREISLLLERRIKNDVARNAIITGVECARDLEFARVYFTTADPAKGDLVLAELKNAKGALRSMLSRILEIRRVPDLMFLIDPSVEYGARIDALLAGIGLNNQNFGGPDPDDEQEDAQPESSAELRDYEN